MATSISVVIPALNEEGIVGNTIKSVPVNKLKKLGLEVEILVVDNNSDDATAEEALTAGARVVTEYNRGYGNAYIRGFAEAKGDILLMADADGTYPLDLSPSFIQPLLEGKADFVIGSRLKGDIQDGAMPPLHRYVGNPILTKTLNLLFGSSISDSHCGMRAFTREAYRRMHLSTPGMEFASEMIIEAARKKLRIVEVPIEYRVRGGGEAKLNSLEDGWRHLRFMLLYSPNALFFLPGGVLFLIGLLLVIALWSGPVSIGGFQLDIHPMVFGELMVGVGIQIFLLGVYTKIFTVIHGIDKPGMITRYFLEYRSLEKELLLGVLIMFIGLFIDGYIIFSWVYHGFGALSELRNIIAASMLIVIGIQLIFSAFFVSVLLLDEKNRNISEF